MFIVGKLKSTNYNRVKTKRQPCRYDETKEGAETDAEWKKSSVKSIQNEQKDLLGGVAPGSDMVSPEPGVLMRKKSASPDNISSRADISSTFLCGHFWGLPEAPDGADLSRAAAW